jgi:hypothetical protein
MAQSGKVSSAANPPFSDDGKAANQGATASGAHNFLEDPKGSGNPGGVRNFAKWNRPQSEAKPEVQPNPQEIPAGHGGRLLRADPSGPSAMTPSGGVQGVSKMPMKGMK